MDVCIDAYGKYFELNEQEPPIDYFGQDREKIIERLMKYMNDNSRLLIDGAAILGAWTDDMAQKIIYGYDPNIYLNAKKFSFILILMKFDDRLDEVLMLAKKALEYFKKNFDENYKLTITVMSNVSSILRKMERYEETLSMTEKGRAEKMARDFF